VLSAAEILDETRMGLLSRRTIVDPCIKQTLSLCELREGRLSRSASTIRRIALRVVDKMVGQQLWPGVEPDELQLTAAE
jgi:hypothetical protein